MNIYLFSLISKFLITGLGIVSSIFINRYLGPSLKGEYAYVLNVVNIATIILNLGIYQSYPFFKRQEAQDIKNRYFSVSILQFALYVALGLLISLFSNRAMFIILTLTPVMILSRQLSFISLVEDINLRNRINLFNQVFYTLVLAILYFTGSSNLVAVFVILYLKELALVAVTIWRFRFKISLRQLDKAFVFKVLRFGFFPMLSVLLITFNYNIDVIILKLYVDFEQIGYYSVGVALANQVWLIPDAFKDVIFKVTAERDSVKEITLSIKINLYISLLIIAGLLLLGEQLIILLYGVAYQPSYLVTLVTVAGVLPMIFFKLIQPLFNATGKQKLSFMILLISALTNVVLNFVFIPAYGILGAALTSVFSYLVSGALFVFFFSRNYKVRLADMVMIKRSEVKQFQRVLLASKRKKAGKDHSEDQQVEKQTDAK